MSTEFDRGSKASGFARFLQGSIEAGELNRALIDERPPAAGVYASPAKKVQGTQTKTCKPTRNPCCKPPAKKAPAKKRADGRHDDFLGGAPVERLFI